MTHRCYYEISADTHYGLGLQMGELFGGVVTSGVEKLGALSPAQQSFARACLAETQRRFPGYAEEMRGYAEGAGVSPDAFWLMSLEGDMDVIKQAGKGPDKCTTMVTNNGRLVAHNEDWDTHATHRIFVLRRRLCGVETLELHYAGTLGGNSISINSHGVLQAINSLPAGPVTAPAPLVPSNVMARFMADAKDPEEAIHTLENTPLLAGYSHTLIDTGGGAHYRVEAAHERVCAAPITQFPFAHANHYIFAELAHLNAAIDADDKKWDKRYEFACAADAQMTAQQAIDFMGDTSAGAEHSVLNERTIGRMVVDADAGEALVWMLREADQGWIAYDLPAIAARGR